MATPDRSRALLATVVGWILAAVVLFVLLRVVFGALGFLVRGILLIVVVLGLLWAYLALKAPDD